LRLSFVAVTDVHNHTGDRKYFYTLALGALGVVYGDIGTSPLYALRECFHSEHGVPPSPANILGILSLIFWSLVIVISLKYLVFVMRADNCGEGGILALMSLVRSRTGRGTRGGRAILIALGLFGAALLYGDGMITPAVTVLSSVEGLEIAAPGVAHAVVPITVVILVILFAMQKIGTAGVGRMFGPVMVLWFFVIAALGIPHIVREPHVLWAVLPIHAIKFFIINKGTGFLVLGAVFLCVTGGEALYADMGHFGAAPIRFAWTTMVFPALLVNYFGQGAFLLRTPTGIGNPFFMMAPAWTLIPLVALATVASVIASQAVISGAFSLTRQAVQLGYLPRIRIRHTSERQIGQIYIPLVNWVLMICAIGLVVAFEKSSALAAAYGVAVTATMAITTLLLAVLEREKWGWTLPAVLAFTIPTIIMDLAFFGANVIKILEGGWFPLAVGVIIFTMMTTWFRGRLILAERRAEQSIGEEDLLRDLGANRIPRVPGTAIFMSRAKDEVPPTLLHNIKHNKVVHQHVVFLTVLSEEYPYVSEAERTEWVDLGQGVHRLIFRYGFMEDVDIPSILESLKGLPVSFDPMRTSYFLGRDTLIPTRAPGMAIWREHLFVWMFRNSTSASAFFNLPANRIIELGAQVEL
jgi:KUP system potassium uptake protein